MTKSQAKSKIVQILEALESVKDIVDDLASEAEETADDIEPYEGKDDLTEAQEERQEWFGDLASILYDAYESLADAQNNLEEKLY